MRVSVVVTVRVRVGVSFLFGGGFSLKKSVFFLFICYTFGR